MYAVSLCMPFKNINYSHCYLVPVSLWFNIKISQTETLSVII